MADRPSSSRGRYDQEGSGRVGGLSSLPWDRDDGEGSGKFKKSSPLLRGRDDQVGTGKFGRSSFPSRESSDVRRGSFSRENRSRDDFSDRNASTRRTDRESGGSRFTGSRTGEGSSTNREYGATSSDRTGRYSSQDLPSDRDYLYSPNVVLPALKNGLRTPYTLYYSHTLIQNRKKKKEDQVANCIAVANSVGVKVVKMDKHQLNAMAGQRPHQGVVLEASQLEQRMVIALGGVSVDNQYNISGKTTETWFKAKENEPPVWLALDEVVDPQNLGAILRTAMFMGVNGVVVCHKNSSPLSAVVAKASTGALEARPTYGVSSLMRFIQMSKENGWHIVGAHVTYGSKRTRPLHTWPETGVDQPTLLIMGNEGNGLRKQIMNQCDAFIQVPCLSVIPSNVDSLNVSVATGIILSKLMGGRFLNLPENLKKYPWRNKDATESIGTEVKKAGGEQRTDDDDNDDDDDVDDNDVDDNEGDDGEEDNTKSPSAPEKSMPW